MKMMDVSGKTILRFLELERDYFYHLAQKYARLSANAENILDPIEYRDAELSRLQYEHYGDAVQLVIDHLKWYYRER